MIVQLLDNKPQALDDYKNDTCKVVLMQSGVYCAHELSRTYEFTDRLYAFKEDFVACGLEPCENIQLINCEQWVVLVAEHYPVVTIQA